MLFKRNKVEEPFFEIEEEDDSFSIDKIVTYFLIACTIVITVLTFFVFYDGISVQKEQEISKYISNADELLKESQQLVEPLSLFAKGESNSYSMEDAALHSLRQTISAGQALDAPKEFLKHRETVNALIVERYAATYTYSLGERSRGVVEENFKKIEDLKTLENTTLISALEEAGLNYKVAEDGNIRIFYKSYKK
ncbi:hypothetical protein [Sutcliffiella deserti]|uniref:hypothetical protein n=1 Tax=Sutcliffiella deserti TaxID=2875501 RepID=UPI001CBB1D12|nr:hypothetical protein [Sutcliffiella deserti]